MIQFYYSETESKSFGLKTGRSGRLTSIQMGHLWDQILRHKFDWVKIKAPLSEKSVYQTLDQLPCFSETFNIIALQQVTPVFRGLPDDCELSFECYDGSQKEEVKKVLLNILSEDTNLYYRSDIYESLVSWDTQTNVSVEFYLSMINKLDSDKFLYIGRNKKGEAVGICSFRKTSGTEAEGVIYGVRPAFRNRQYAAFFLQHSINTLALEGITTFYTEVQYHNFRSLYPHIKIGFKPAGLYLNLNIFPFLSCEIQHFNCPGNKIRQQFEEFIRLNKNENIKPKWSAIRGDSSLLFTNQIVHARVVLFTSLFTIGMAQIHKDFCYFKILHIFE